jgi:hypothetical protein
MSNAYAVRLPSSVLLIVLYNLSVLANCLPQPLSFRVQCFVRVEDFIAALLDVLQFWKPTARVTA